MGSGWRSYVSILAPTFKWGALATIAKLSVSKSQSNVKQTQENIKFQKFGRKRFKNKFLVALGSIPIEREGDCLRKCLQVVEM